MAGTLQSKNMNYIFNREYFNGIKEKEEEKGNDFDIPNINEKNAELINFGFDYQKNKELEKLPGYQEIVLYSKYPGIMIGTGNPHSMKADGVIKCGFTFDYVSGLPYLPGSSLKGILRSYFPSGHKDNKQEYISYIKECLQKENVNVEALESNIFEGDKDGTNKRDLFFDSYAQAIQDNRCLMELDFITPHQGITKAPNPINMIKVRPNIPFCFQFVLHDYKDEMGNVIVSGEEKRKLFQSIILDMGVGAKTNVGFGKFGLTKAKNVKLPEGVSATTVIKKKSEDSKNKQQTTGKCKICNNETSFNKKTNKNNRYCQKCFNKMLRERNNEKKI